MKKRDELATKFDQLKKKYVEKKNVINAQSQVYVKVTNDLRIIQKTLASAEIQRDQAIQNLENTINIIIFLVHLNVQNGSYIYRTHCP